MTLSIHQIMYDTLSLTFVIQGTQIRSERLEVLNFIRYVTYIAGEAVVRALIRGCIQVVGVQRCRRSIGGGVNTIQTPVLCKR